jgi:mono/diheme cytochrome c family protein
MRPAGSRSRFFYGLLTGIVITALLTAIFSAPLLLTHRAAGSLERDYAAFMRGLTTRLGGRNAGSNPVSGTPQAAQNGQIAYNGVCLQCHGAAGRGNGVFGQQTFPEAANLLDDSTRKMSDGQLFYIIKNGLGFTPMPSYGDQYSDEMIWSLVSYVRRLQNEQDGNSLVEVPTGQQSTGNAQRGAVLFRAEGCVNCHGSLPGQIVLSPQTNMISQTVRLGQPGMPCFSRDRLSDAELADIIAYIATFPQVAAPSGPPQGTPTGGGARPSGPPPGGGGQGGVPPSQAPSPCATSSGITQPTGPAATPSR